MSLNEELAAVELEIIGRLGEDIRSLFDAQISTAESHLSMAPGLSVGSVAPDFSLTATGGQTISLQGALRQGPVILTFYRGSWCNFCNMALKIWQDYLPEILGKGATLYAISPEKPANGRKFKKAAGLEYELLYDTGNKVGDAYGLVFTLPTSAQKKLADLGTDVGNWNGNGNWDVPVTATFIVGQDQRIRLVDCGPDYRQRLEPKLVISNL